MRDLYAGFQLDGYPSHSPIRCIRSPRLTINAQLSFEQSRTKSLHEP